MPRFSNSSFSHLSTCDQELQVLFFEVIKTFDCTVIEGHRGEQKQTEAFENGRSQLPWPKGRHNHVPSLAVDVSPYPVCWDSAQKNIARFYFFAGYVLATVEKLKAEGKMTKSIRWGGDWDCDKDFSDQKFDDLVHFELI